MWEFFKPWRRRIGMMTLLMALVFMVGWVRSEFIDDRFSKSCENGRIVVFSNSGHVGFQRREFGGELRVPEPFVNFESHIITKRRNFLGFHIVMGDDIRGWSDNYVVPYWMIVLPLTVFSAFLLISKPRQSTPKETALPISIDEGVTT